MDSTTTNNDLHFLRDMLSTIVEDKNEESIDRFFHDDCTYARNGESLLRADFLLSRDGDESNKEISETCVIEQSLVKNENRNRKTFGLTYDILHKYRDRTNRTGHAQAIYVIYDGKIASVVDVVHWEPSKEQEADNYIFV